ncbi:HlyD family type I secretion periplasmic adaptor subunit [Endozoicomonas lisbonensis]|uniref:Membrane fusion protein (MFP) family protein n=1 Tax=Endozoicomonas lisbonensis TaxID=3120522 RepID=A0ABV2SRF4_9GAMM
MRIPHPLQLLFSRHSITAMCLLTLTLLLIWSWQTPIDRFVYGQGKVTTFSDHKVIEHFEGGILSGIHIAEGQTVQAGTLLFSVENPGVLENASRIHEQLLAKKAKTSRLQAEYLQKPFIASTDRSQPWQLQAETYLKNERQLFLLRENNLLEDERILEQKRAKEQARFEETTQTLKDLDIELAVATEQLQILEQSMKNRAGSRVVLLDKRMEVVRTQTRMNQSRAKLPVIAASLKELELQKQQLRLKFREAVQDEYNQEIAEIALLQEQWQISKQRQVRTEIRSPVNGTVHRLYTSTEGEVVTPGTVIAEIVPENEPLLIEARIDPYDRARVWQGQDANLRVTAYDYSEHGSLSGTIKEISADTFVDELSGQPYYQVIITTDSSGKSEEHPLIQGMTVDVNIIAGRQSVLSYLLPDALSMTPFQSSLNPGAGE